MALTAVGQDKAVVAVEAEAGLWLLETHCSLSRELRLLVVLVGLVALIPSIPAAVAVVLAW
ncbi:hypothetical protein BSPA111_24720 [Buttiauxella sp. A111]|nr:hypothetical protein BSPA111_24720 [Buttiauxella sp. A111]